MPPNIRITEEDVEEKEREEEREEEEEEAFIVAFASLSRPRGPPSDGTVEAAVTGAPSVTHVTSFRSSSLTSLTSD